jgi:hypothetical protein
VNDKILSFDLETAVVLPKNSELSEYMPIPISVAATAILGGEERLWYSVKDDGTPADKVDRSTASELLQYLEQKQSEGYFICGWNSLNFDFHCLASASGLYKKCAQIAKDSYDPMYQFFNQEGFFVGLQAVSDGFTLGFEKSLQGHKVPKMWLDGECDEVFSYVMSDCRMTNSVIKALQTNKKIIWRKKNGQLAERQFQRLKKCKEVMQSTFIADQSWMDDPPSKWRFTTWFPVYSFPENADECIPPVMHRRLIYQVFGADKQTAKDLSVDVESVDEKGAISKANELGIYVSKVVPYENLEANAVKKHFDCNLWKKKQYQNSISKVKVGDHIEFKYDKDVCKNVQCYVNDEIVGELGPMVSEEVAGEMAIDTFIDGVVIEIIGGTNSKPEMGIRLTLSIGSRIHANVKNETGCMVPIILTVGILHWINLLL